MSWSARSEISTPARSAEGHDEPLVVAFTAPWCGHCRSMLPGLLRAAEQQGAPRLEVIDVSSAPEAASMHAVAATPTVIGFSNGVEVDRMVGRKGPTEVAGFFHAVAAHTPRRRSRVDPILRFGGAVVIAAVGFLADAAPLVWFALLVAMLSAASEWRARRG